MRPKTAMSSIKNPQSTFINQKANKHLILNPNTLYDDKATAASTHHFISPDCTPMQARKKFLNRTNQNYQFEKSPNLSMDMDTLNMLKYNQNSPQNQQAQTSQKKIQIIKIVRKKKNLDQDSNIYSSPKNDYVPQKSVLEQITNFEKKEKIQMILDPQTVVKPSLSNRQLKDNLKNNKNKSLFLEKSKKKHKKLQKSSSTIIPSVDKTNTMLTNRYGKRCNLNYRIKDNFIIDNTNLKKEEGSYNKIEFTRHDQRNIGFAVTPTNKDQELKLINDRLTMAKTRSKMKKITKELITNRQTFEIFALSHGSRQQNDQLHIQHQSIVNSESKWHPKKARNSSMSSVSLWGSKYFNDVMEEGMLIKSKKKIENYKSLQKSLRISYKI